MSESAGIPLSDCFAVTEEDLKRQGAGEFFGIDRATSHPVLCWFSRAGAEQGTPWCVHHTDGSQELVSAVRMTGVVDFIAAPEGLLDGPRFVARLTEGQMMAGK